MNAKTTHDETPTPAIRRVTAVQRGAQALLKKALKATRPKCDVIDALIRKWYPDYRGRYSFTDTSSVFPRIVLWSEQEWLDSKPTDFSRWTLDARASWRHWSGLNDLREALTVLHLLRGLQEDSTVCRRTLTLTVVVEDPEDRGNHRKTRYIDVETGKEWRAQCWQARAAEMAAEGKAVAA